MIKINNIVSFETAYLLKNKGFNEICNSHYFYKKLYPTIVRWTNSEDKYTAEATYCTAPTIYQVAEWLREIHNIHISIEVSQIYYYYTISLIPNGKIKLESSNKYFTFEEAFKEAINFTLTLI